ncbi:MULTISPECIES: hypothetical protein [Nonomuraea]|jgi:hypothetical protein|uniref:Spy/CpxP family protein refolding chaperone n=2 Tax=Nonomuraea TaxID=83681 RepID=A0A7W5Y800_9ACTN|nr:hypothetical protein [Nonomuraea dietziae]MBB3727923.1 Spy/CpxP family protein refolding chaperone [Nonomuraea dietziae]
MLSPRHLAAIAILGGLVLAVLGVLSLTGAVSPAAALAAAAFLLALSALAFLVLTVRRLDGKAHRIDLRVKKIENGLTQSATGLKRIESRIDRLSAAVEESATRRNEDLSAILASLGEDRVNAMTHAEEVAELRAALRELREERV